jgi:lipocalin-like protein
MRLPRDTRNLLVGTWQLVSVKFELTDTGESMDMYGSEPLGYFILTAEGRLMVIETARDRQPPQNDVDNASLFKSMLAYSGHCRVLDDNRFVTNVDVAWHPAWMNTEQTRAFEIDGDLLSVSTVGMVHPNFPGRTGQAVVRWRRMSA